MEKKQGLPREVLPHAVWFGIEWTGKKIIETLAGSALITAGWGILARYKNHLDITTLIGVFVLSILVLFWNQRRGAAWTRNDELSESGLAGSIFRIPLRTTTLDPRSSDPGTTYKAKLRLVFTNDRQETVQVLPPSWIMGKDDVPAQFPLGSKYQVEKTQGSYKSVHPQDRWSGQELDEGTINPGWSFTLYIGLDQSVSHEELLKRWGHHRLGTLRIPLRIGNDHVVHLEERV